MIVTNLGYGYISIFLLKEIASNGVRCIGITDKTKYHNKKYIENISILPRSNTVDAIKKSTHLIVTAPPNNGKCPIFSKYEKVIKDSNIRSILYVSSTGVYGDHNGDWVNEKSIVKGSNNIVNKNRIKSENSWLKFCQKNLLKINIVRLGGIYGPGRPLLNKAIFENIIIKQGHFFSRIHVLDISRLIVNILFEYNKSSFWNLVDELPSTRKDFIERIIKLKKVKIYSYRNYEEIKRNIPKSKKKFWEANKKVSSEKVKKKISLYFSIPIIFNRT